MIKMTPLEDFPLCPVSRQNVLQNGRKYLGFSYTHRSSVVWQTQPLSGKFSCIGFVLQVAKESKMIPQDYPINTGRPDKDSTLEDNLRAFLSSNFHDIPLASSGPGDLLLMRYHLIDPRAPLHVSIKTSWECAPDGAMIHSVNSDLGGDACGGVREDRIDAFEWEQVLSAHSYKGFVD